MKNGHRTVCPRVERVPWRCFCLCCRSVFSAVSVPLSEAPCMCSLPASSVHGISQAGILEWVAISFSRGSSQPREQTHLWHWQADCLPLSHQRSPIEIHVTTTNPKYSFWYRILPGTSILLQTSPFLTCLINSVRLMSTRARYVQGASTSGDLGAEIFPRLVPANSWIHPLALQGRVSLSPRRLSPGVRLSSPCRPPTLLLLRSSDSPPKASFELCMQSIDLWFGHSRYLNHFLWLSFLLNYKYLMTACKSNMGMLWTCYVEKNNLGVSDSFTASYRSPPKQRGIKHGLSFPIIGYSTCKQLHKNKGAPLNTPTSLRTSFINLWIQSSALHACPLALLLSKAIVMPWICNCVSEPWH